jgi:hypothetical protein
VYFTAKSDPLSIINLQVERPVPKNRLQWISSNINDCVCIKDLRAQTHLL